MIRTTNAIFECRVQSEDFLALDGVLGAVFRDFCIRVLKVVNLCM
jgi:hypothetical protein